MKRSRYTGREPASAVCPECGRKIATRDNGAGSDLFTDHRAKDYPQSDTIHCPMSRRDVPKTTVKQ
jgi:hypothetical protein